MLPEIVTLQSQSTAIPERLSERLRGLEPRPPSRSNASNVISGGRERRLSTWLPISRQWRLVRAISPE